MGKRNFKFIQKVKSNMKKIISIALTAFFITVLSAQVPNGTYLPCNDIAKNMYIEKVVFNNTKKVTIYFGTMGMTMGFEEFNYEVQDMDKKLPFVQVYFEYDKTNDILVFGEAYANSMLKMLSQMGNSAKLMYNKSGNCNPNLVGNSKIRILVKDNNQDVYAEIINNYIIIPDNNNIIPRLDKNSAIKSGKYTDTQIATATKILHDEIENYLGGLQNKIVAANLILTYIGNNSTAFVDGIEEIVSLFNPVDYFKGKLQDWALGIINIKIPSAGEIVGQDVSKDIKNITPALDGLNKLIEALRAQNNQING
ncbi:hypothetical protein FACS1894207_2480 [Bacteroidia bacterium]|nr:hypothetical protein FACS1894207_2480 [Bacteroidia bacterium]